MTEHTETIDGGGRTNPPGPAGIPGPADRAVPREAILFVPGLGGDGGGQIGPDQSVDGVALRISNALDRDARTPSAKFSVQVREQSYGPANCFQTRVCTIERTDGGQPSRLIDVYGIAYGTSLSKRFDNSNLLVRNLLLFLQIVSSGATARCAMRRSTGLTGRQKFQFFFAGGILLLLCLYMGLLAVAAVNMVVEVPGLGKSETVRVQAPPGAAGATRPDAKTRTVVQSTRTHWWMRSLLILAAAAGMLLPKNWKDLVGKAATQYVCALYYIRTGARKMELIGQLESLLEWSAEQADARYSRVHVIGYSFGSLLALDALFPSDHAPPERLRLVDTLVTIGCPFDLVRTFWPAYFAGRYELAGGPVPRGWLNIYSPIDVLGSNFRNDEQEAPPATGITVSGGAGQPPSQRMPTRNAVYSAGVSAAGLTRFDYISLAGFRLHASYWSGKDDAAAEDCFTEVVRALYAGAPPSRLTVGGDQARSTGLCKSRLLRLSPVRNVGARHCSRRARRPLRLAVRITSPCFSPFFSGRHVLGRRDRVEQLDVDRHALSVSIFLFFLFFRFLQVSRYLTFSISFGYTSAFEFPSQVQDGRHDADVHSPRPKAGFNLRVAVAPFFLHRLPFSSTGPRHSVSTGGGPVHSQTQTTFKAINDFVTEDEIDLVVKKENLSESDVAVMLSAADIAKWENAFSAVDAYCNSLTALLDPALGKDLEQSVVGAGTELKNLDKNALPDPVISTAFAKVGGLLVEAKAQADALKMAREADPAMQVVFASMAHAVGSNDRKPGLITTVLGHWTDRLAVKEDAFHRGFDEFHKAHPTPSPDEKAAFEGGQRKIVQEYIQLRDQRDAQLLALVSLRKTLLGLADAHSAMARGSAPDLSAILTRLQTELDSSKGLFDQFKALSPAAAPPKTATTKPGKDTTNG